MIMDCINIHNKNNEQRSLNNTVQEMQESHESEGSDVGIKTNKDDSPSW